LGLPLRSTVQERTEEVQRRIHKPHQRFLDGLSFADLLRAADPGSASGARNHGEVLAVRSEPDFEAWEGISDSGH